MTETNTPMRADFVDAYSVPTRGMYKLEFEVPIEMANQVLQALGGVPQPKNSRQCAIVLLNDEDDFLNKD